MHAIYFGKDGVMQMSNVNMVYRMMETLMFMAGAIDPACGSHFRITHRL